MVLLLAPRLKVHTSALDPLIGITYVHNSIQVTRLDEQGSDTYQEEFSFDFTNGESGEQRS